MASTHERIEANAPYNHHSDTLQEIRSRCPLDNGRHPYRPQCTLGILELFPLEILSIVLVHLDIRTLTDFRRVNHRARQVVDSVPEYKMIILYAPDTIRVTLCIGTGILYTCHQLYDKLCTAECDTCGDFASVIYLPTCSRICCFCHMDRNPLRPMDALRDYGLRRKDVASLPLFMGIPRKKKGYHDRQDLTRLTFVDRTLARKAGLALHGTSEAMEERVLEMEAERVEKFNARERLYRSGNGPKPRLHEFDTSRKSNPGHYHLGDIFVPFLGNRAEAPEWGYRCCCARGLSKESTRRCTKKGFEEHLRKAKEDKTK